MSIQENIRPTSRKSKPAQGPNGQPLHKEVRNRGTKMHADKKTIQVMYDGKQEVKAP